MEDLLRELDYPDTKVAEDIRNGFPLRGEMPSTGVFAKKPDEDIDHGADPAWLDIMAQDLR